MTVNNKRKPRGLYGFTMIELMIVLAVIGILASLAYSSYDQYVTRARRAEAFAALEQMAGAMEKNFTINARYLPSTAAAFIVPPASIFTDTVPLDGGDPYYNLRVRSQAETRFTVRAAPVGVQAGDGNIEMDNDGSKRWDQDGDGNFGTNENNWKKN